MTTTDIAVGLGGNVTYRKFTITYLDLQATSGSGAKAIALVNSGAGSPGTFNIPPAGAILGVLIKHSVAFAGGSLSAMTVSLGKSGTATYFTTTLDIFAAVSDTALLETALFKHGQLTALNPVATFTPTGDSNSAATAGSVDIYVLFLNTSTS